MHGATGVDLAYTAAGCWVAPSVSVTTSGTMPPVSRWCASAGGIVTDLAGEPWTAKSQSALAGMPGVHDELLEIVNSVGDPEDY